MDPTTISITSWNAQSVRPNDKYAELCTFIHHHSPDVVSIQETFLSENTRFFIPNYRVFRSDRDTHGGGVLLMVKSNIKANKLPDLRLTAIETVAVELEIPNSQPITIVAVYVPRMRPALREETKRILAIPNVIAIGDWNAKTPLWSLGQNAYGGVIESLLDTEEFRILAPSEPTYISNTNECQSTIDFIISNSTHNIDEPHIEHSLRSDHYAISTVLHIRPVERVTERFAYDQADWFSYRQEMSNFCQNAQIGTTHAELDAALSLLITAIINARNAYVPKVPTRRHLNTLSAYTMDLVAQKQQARRQLMRCTDDYEKAMLRQRIRLLNPLSAKIFKLVISSKFSYGWLGGGLQPLKKTTPTLQPLKWG